ncbi:hypothetical protein SETIT_8G028500v2 [Setaria italica]|uniref:Uncharacterized protein n=1 Tax=Setaria italica TaxID=4555 RepID=A0A368S3N0_SETIT|nr:hypothetical protein SETIT_8G028500v2 [Setaria italica]
MPQYLVRSSRKKILWGLGTVPKLAPIRTCFRCPTRGDPGHPTDHDEVRFLGSRHALTSSARLQARFASVLLVCGGSSGGRDEERDEPRRDRRRRRTTRARGRLATAAASGAKHDG